MARLGVVGALLAAIARSGSAWVQPLEFGSPRERSQRSLFWRKSTNWKRHMNSPRECARRVRQMAARGLPTVAPYNLYQERKAA